MNNVISTYVALGLAIVTEVVGTTFLELSQQLTRLLPTFVMGVCYLASLYFLSLALKASRSGVTYASERAGDRPDFVGRLREVSSGARPARAGRRWPDRRRRRHRERLFEIHRSLRAASSPRGWRFEGSLWARGAIVMCIGCHWASFRNFDASSLAQFGSGLATCRSR